MANRAAALAVSRHLPDGRLIKLSLLLLTGIDKTGPSLWGCGAPKSATPAPCAPRISLLVSLGRTSPIVCELITSEPFTPVLDQAAATVGLSAAEFRRPSSARQLLSHLEGDIAAMADDLRADLDQLPLRQAADRLGRRQCPQEVAEVVGEGMEVELHGVGGERTARQTQPGARVLAFLDPLLGRAALVHRPARVGPKS